MNWLHGRFRLWFAALVMFMLGFPFSKKALASSMRVIFIPGGDSDSDSDGDS